MVIQQRVEKVRRFQQARQGLLNSELSVADLAKRCALDRECRDFLSNVIEQLHLSARAYHRILKLARTIADMSASEAITQQHLGEAVAYRSLDRC